MDFNLMQGDVKDFLPCPDTGRLYARVSAVLGRTKQNAGAFYGYLRRAKQSGDFSKSQAACKRGTDLHAAAEHYLQGWPYQVGEDANPYWEQLEPVLKDCTLQLAEYRFFHPDGFTGKLDALVNWKGQRNTLIDYKTYGNPEKPPGIDQQNDWFCQLAAYSVGLEWQRGATVKRAAIFMISRESIQILELDRDALKGYWSQFQTRLAEYWELLKADQERRKADHQSMIEEWGNV